MLAAPGLPGLPQPADSTAEVQPAGSAVTKDQVAEQLIFVRPLHLPTALWLPVAAEEPEVLLAVLVVPVADRPEHREPAAKVKVAQPDHKVPEETAAHQMVAPGAQAADWVLAEPVAPAPPLAVAVVVAVTTEAAVEVPT